MEEEDEDAEDGDLGGEELSEDDDIGGPDPVLILLSTLSLCPLCTSKPCSHARHFFPFLTFSGTGSLHSRATRQTHAETKSVESTFERRYCACEWTRHVVPSRNL